MSLAALASLRPHPFYAAHTGAEVAAAPSNTAAPSGAEPLKTSTIVGFAVASLAIPLVLLMIREGAEKDATKLAEKEVLKSQISADEYELRKAMIEREADRRVSSYPTDGYDFSV